MSRRMVALTLVCALVGVGASLLARRAETAAGPTYHSPIAVVLSPDGRTLYVSDHTADSVAIIDTQEGAVRGSVPVPAPDGLAVSPDGKTLYVAARELDRVYEVDTASLKVRGSLGVGRRPAGLALAADGRTLYCCNQFTDDVSVIDVDKMAETSRLKVTREPCFAAPAEGGKTLVVANLLPLGSNLDDSLGAEVTLLGLADGATTNIKLSLGATAVGQVCCSPDGRFAYVGHVLARWLVPPTQLDRGWIATNALTVIDVPAKKALGTVLLDDLDRGAANPHGMAMSASGEELYVTHSGTHEVQIVDTAKLHTLIEERPADARVALENDLTAVYRADVRRRVASGGVGPRGIAARDGELFVANYYSGTVARIETEGGKVTGTISLGEQPEMDAIRRGEMLFGDARICFQGWQSCVTCHPDGRSDGLAWDLLNDGMGNPKNAKSLLLSGKTPPVMASGVRARMEVASLSGVKFILFRMPDDETVAALSAYIDSMQPARSPYRSPDGALSEAGQRGKALFESPETGCARCHPAPLFTDLNMYDVGTRHKYDHRDDFDTPTLIEMFRSAPFLHDGSAVTIHDVLTEHNRNDLHGRTSHLSEQQLADLGEYVLSL